MGKGFLQISVCLTASLVASISMGSFFSTKEQQFRDQIRNLEQKRDALRLLNSRGVAVVPSMCNGRLTAVSATPVPTSNQTSVGTIYFTPYQGNKITIFNGTNWILYTFTERSLSLSGLVASGSNYDVFIYNNSGTLTLELSAAWTTDNGRADAIVLQDGVYVKSGATTRRYLGTLRGTGSGTTEDSTSKRFIWNNENRVLRHMQVTEATTTWTYNTATWRPANNSSSNALQFVIGLPEVLAKAMVTGFMSNSYGAASNQPFGIGLDSTSTNSAQAFGTMNTYSGLPIRAYYYGLPATSGYHYLQWLERSISNGSTTTYYGTNGGGSPTNSGIIGEIFG